MKKIVYVICFYFLILFSGINAFSESDNTFVHLIFNKVSFSKGEVINLTINLENFSNLNETKVIIKCDESIIKPILSDSNYGKLLNNSIYDDVLINEYVNGYIRFHLVKKSLDSGYFSGYKNNVGEFLFVAGKNITNIYDYFQVGSFSELNTGINITLYDIYNNNINTTFRYSDKIKINWDIDKYILEVYSEKINYLNDIEIINRNVGEYELLIEEDINLSVVGSSIINVVVIDKTNADFIMISKVCDVVDTTKPVINGNNSITINSDKLDEFNLLDHYEIKDNYDLVVTEDIKYYDNNSNEIVDFNKFKEYLNNNLYGKVIIYAVDSNNNKSDDFYIDVQINDVTAPNIREISSFIVEDVNLPTFDLNELFLISDDYDDNPILEYEMYVNDVLVTDLKHELLLNNKVLIKYYGIDKFNNKTKEYICYIKIKDTIAPVISEVSYIKLTDKEILNYDLLKLIEITDNIDHMPSIIFNYYIENKEMTYNNFINYLCLGKSGYVTYYGLDSSGNKTDKFKLEFDITDTIAPIIEVENIKNGGRYIVGKKINYNVSDNFSDELDVVVTLNNESYNNEEIKEVGEYTFKIEAVDEAGNKNILIVKFDIIENNFIGCGDDLDCYKDNYLEVLLLSIILLIIIITIFVIKMLLKKKNKKNNISDNKIDN